MPENTLQHLQDRAHRNLLTFLKTEVELGMTFADIAKREREAGNVKHYEKNKAAALKAVETIERFKERLPYAAARRDIETRSLALAEALSTL